MPLEQPERAIAVFNSLTFAMCAMRRSPNSLPLFALPTLGMKPQFEENTNHRIRTSRHRPLHRRRTGLLPLSFLAGAFFGFFFFNGFRFWLFSWLFFWFALRSLLCHFFFSALQILDRGTSLSCRRVVDLLALHSSCNQQLCRWLQHVHCRVPAVENCYRVISNQPPSSTINSARFKVGLTF